MNAATLTRVAPGVSLPGLGWLPKAMRTAAYWRSVFRWVAWGPLIGGAPYNLFIIPIPFAYAIGAGPALLAGLLFAAWWHAPGARSPTWPWRLLFGSLCGAAGSLLAALIYGAWSGSAVWSVASMLGWHGVPAGALLALWTRKRVGTPSPFPGSK